MFGNSIPGKLITVKTYITSHITSLPHRSTIQMKLGVICGSDGVVFYDKINGPKVNGSNPYVDTGYPLYVVSRLD